MQRFEPARRLQTALRACRRLLRRSLSSLSRRINTTSVPFWSLASEVPLRSIKSQQRGTLPQVGSKSSLGACRRLFRRAFFIEPTDRYHKHLSSEGTPARN